MLGIEFPILAFSHCRDVVAAVTNAGGFGVLGAVAHGPEELEVDLPGPENVPRVVHAAHVGNADHRVLAVHDRPLRVQLEAGICPCYPPKRYA